MKSLFEKTNIKNLEIKIDLLDQQLGIVCQKMMVI